MKKAIFRFFLIGIALLTITGCVYDPYTGAYYVPGDYYAYPPPPGPYGPPGDHWVPGHWRAEGDWAPGHWAHWVPGHPQCCSFKK